MILATFTTQKNENWITCLEVHWLSVYTCGWIVLVPGSGTATRKPTLHWKTCFVFPCPLNSWICPMSINYSIFSDKNWQTNLADLRHSTTCTVVHFWSGTLDDSTKADFFTHSWIFTQDISHTQSYKTLLTVSMKWLKSHDLILHINILPFGSGH